MASAQGGPALSADIAQTLASSLFEKGLRIQDIAELLGHANSSVTETVYVDVRKEAKVRLSEALMNPFDLDYNSVDGA